MPTGQMRLKRRDMRRGLPCMLRSPMSCIDSQEEAAYVRHLSI